MLDDNMKAAREDYFDTVERTGRWWENPWWEQPDCNMHFPVPLEAVRRSASILREHFDEDWYRELATEHRPRGNIVFPKLCLERSSFALNFIARLGARLERLRGATNVQRPLRALRDTDGKAAFLELEAADAFADAGFAITSPFEGEHKSSDVVASHDGVDIYIECKRLGDEEWEDWEDELMQAVMLGLPSEHKGADLAIEVSLNPRLSELRMGKIYSDLNRAILACILDTILGSINDHLLRDTIPVQFTIQEIATITIEHKRTGHSGSVQGMSRSSPAIFRRMFQNGVLRALEQLPEEKSGVIVLFSKHAPPPAFFELLFGALTKADPKRFAALTGILVCTLQTWFHNPPPTLFVNPHTKDSRAASLVSETLAAHFGAQIRRSEHDTRI